MAETGGLHIYSLWFIALKHTTEHTSHRKINRKERKSARQKSILHLLDVGCCAPGVWKETSS